MQHVQQDQGVNYRGAPAETLSLSRKLHNYNIEDIMGLFLTNYSWLSELKLTRDGLLYYQVVSSAKYW